jgi:hypothetical protein
LGEVDHLLNVVQRDREEHSRELAVVLPDRVVDSLVLCVVLLIRYSQLQQRFDQFVAFIEKMAPSVARVGCSQLSSRQIEWGVPPDREEHSTGWDMISSAREIYAVDIGCSLAGENRETQLKSRQTEWSVV